MHREGYKGTRLRHGPPAFPQVPVHDRWLQRPSLSLSRLLAQTSPANLASGIFLLVRQPAPFNIRLLLIVRHLACQAAGSDSRVKFQQTGATNQSERVCLRAGTTPRSSQTDITEVSPAEKPALLALCNLPLGTRTAGSALAMRVDDTFLRILLTEVLAAFLHAVHQIARYGTVSLHGPTPGPQCAMKRLPHTVQRLQRPACHLVLMKVRAVIKGRLCR